MKRTREMKAGQMVSRYSSLRTLLVFEGLLVGIVSGLVTSLYRYVLDRADDIRNAALGLCSGHPLRMACWFGILIVLAVLVTALLKWEPMISGSGIPQVEAELLGYIRPRWWRVILGKIAAGFLCIVGGLSLGREGPSIQLGGMAGKGVSRWLKRFRLEEHFLITCGASAGLSAAFNAPLAGVMFARDGAAVLHGGLPHCGLYLKRHIRHGTGLFVPIHRHDPAARVCIYRNSGCTVRRARRGAQRRHARRTDII